ncbi:MAG: hypothetical protein NTU90_00225 [Proteobacteria bacterium]|nr:hypothetical protein [Pseudomonadota bacterium]
MKDQYFGDINDYRKYGLLRSIIRGGKFNPLIAWMLTPDDGTTDGKFISYLEHPNKWSRYDQALFQKLKDLLVNNEMRQVNLIENSDLLSNTKYYSRHVPNSASDRDSWFASLMSQAQNSDLVFLDPDNGLEVKSKSYGCKNSSKFLYWREVASLWSSGKSLLIYQHFIREKRFSFIQRMLKALNESTQGSLVEAFSTPHVVFLMALQPGHQRFHKAIVSTVQKNWEGQIHHWEL